MRWNGVVVRSAVRVALAHGRDDELGPGGEVDGGGGRRRGRAPRDVPPLARPGLGHRGREVGGDVAVPGRRRGAEGSGGGGGARVEERGESLPLGEHVRAGEEVLGELAAERRVATARAYRGRPAVEEVEELQDVDAAVEGCLLYTSPSPRDATLSRMPSSA